MKNVIELVVYRIKPEQMPSYVEQSIEHFRKLVMSFEGFISYEFYQGCKEQNLFMDFVSWNSLKNADEAARQVKIIQKLPEYAQYLGAFEEVEIFSHFTLQKSWAK